MAECPWRWSGCRFRRHADTERGSGGWPEDGKHDDPDRVHRRSKASGEQRVHFARDSRTPKATYDRKVRAALQELLATQPPERITDEAICGLAGVSTDPLRADHHRQLRSDINEALAAGIAEQNVRTSKRARARTELEDRIKALESKNQELDYQLKNAQSALNLLGQMLESAISGKPLAQVLPMQRPPRRPSE